MFLYDVENFNFRAIDLKLSPKVLKTRKLIVAPFSTKVINDNDMLVTI